MGNNEEAGVQSVPEEIAPDKNNGYAHQRKKEATIVKGSKTFGPSVGGEKS